MVGLLTTSSPVLMVEMAPYIRTTSIKPPNAGLLPDLEKKNTAELESIETKLKDAEENQGESEVSELLRSKAMYLCRIGNKVRVLKPTPGLTMQELALPALETALEKTAGLGARIDLVLAMVRLGLFSSDVQLVTSSMTRAAE